MLHLILKDRVRLGPKKLRMLVLDPKGPIVHLLTAPKNMPASVERTNLYSVCMTLPLEKHIRPFPFVLFIYFHCAGVGLKEVTS